MWVQITSSTTNIPYRLVSLLLLLLCIRLVFTCMNPDKNVCIPYDRKHLWRNVISAIKKKKLLTIYHPLLLSTNQCLVCLQVLSTWLIYKGHHIYINFVYFCLFFRWEDIIVFPSGYWEKGVSLVESYHVDSHVFLQQLHDSSDLYFHECPVYGILCDHPYKKVQLIS